MKEEEIRPQQIFDEYLRLAEEDARVYFGSIRHPVLCPACGNKGVFSFSKHDFSYEECPTCYTLFVSPRPPATEFFRYYKDSPSARYFGTTFYHATAEARREKLWKPKAFKVSQILSEQRATNYQLVDIGGGHGIFAEEYKKLQNRTVIVIEPGCDSAQICRDKGFQVLESLFGRN